MAEDKKVTISRTRNEGNIIYYIARNSSGTIFARELTLEKLEAAIKTYKEPPPIEEKTEEETIEDKLSSPGDKKFFENDLKTKIQKRKEQEEKSQKKKSFWDKLK